MHILVHISQLVVGVTLLVRKLLDGAACVRVRLLAVVVTVRARIKYVRATHGT